MDISVVMQTMAKLFLLMLLGFVLYKTGILDDVTSKKVSSLLSNVTAPFLLISSVTGIEGEKSLVFKLIGIGLLLYFGLICFGFVFSRALPFPKKNRSTYECMFVFGNTAYMGYPVLISLFGNSSVFYSSMLHLCGNFLIYTYMIYCLTRGSGKDEKFTLSKMVTPGFLLTFIAPVFFILNVRLPVFLNETITMVGSMTTPMAMMLIGASLASYPRKNSFNDWRAYLYSFVKLLVLPFISMLVCRLLGVPPFYANLAIVINGMPLASMVLVMATKYDAGRDIVVKGIVVSTLLSLFSIPLVASFMFL